jgi:hypothetical protein
MALAMPGASKPQRGQVLEGLARDATAQYSRPRDPRALVEIHEVFANIHKNVAERVLWKINRPLWPI